MPTLHHSLPRRFQPALLASLITAALMPHGVLALDLATTVVGRTAAFTETGYVTPNIIFSLDNSEFTKNQNISINGKSTSASQVMTNMLIDAMRDTTAFPDGSFRFSWQTMPNGCASDASIRTVQELGKTSREQFIEYLQKFDSCSWRTTSQRIANNAFFHMAAPLDVNSPWAFKPGIQGSPYLGCRRNYHFILSGNAYTEGRDTFIQDSRYRDWPLLPTASSGWRLPDDKHYLDLNAQAKNPALADQYRAYTSNSNMNGLGHLGSISNITMAGWFPVQYYKPDYKLNTFIPRLPPTSIASPFSVYLQEDNPPAVTLEGKLPPNAEYENAPETETIIHRNNGTSVTLQKYWNPRYNPARWPHMVTHTFGLGDKAIPRFSYVAPGTADRVWRRDAVQPTNLSPYGMDGDFVEYAKGILTWRALDDQYHTNQQFQSIGNPEDGRRYSFSLRAGDSALDLWRAAFVSRGNYYVVQRGNEVAHALRRVIDQSKADFGGSPAGAPSSMTAKAGTARGSSSAVLSGATASGENVTRSPVRLFKSYYDAGAGWRGWITGQTLAGEGNTAVTAGIDEWQGQTTAQRIDAMNPASRVILGWRDATEARAAGGVAFRWASDGQYLSPAQNALLAGTDGKGEQRLNYLRGDRSLEGNAPTQFRARQSAHGDIVNSQIWYTAEPVGDRLWPGFAAFHGQHRTRTPMLYVGANDGMLHGFSAEDGTEKLAYVPRGVMPHLAGLTSHGYESHHRYLVDGSPMTGDVRWAAGSETPQWRTLLVGTLGAGGRGYFVLDVTDPASFSEQGTNATSTVVMDKTLTESELLLTCPTSISCLSVPEADLGHITAVPVRHDGNPLRASQITRMNDNRWAVVLGNGYNSINNRAVLLVQYLDGAKELLRLPVPNLPTSISGPGSHDNGLSAPRVVDLNADGRADVVYAGDNFGNLWKFDLTSNDPAQWNVAFGGTPLYRTEGENRGENRRVVRQPISTAPIVRANDRMRTVGSGTAATTVAVGGMMVVFGTGRNVTKDDADNLQVQSLYGVLDNTRYSYKGTGDDMRLRVQSACTSCDDGKAVANAEPAGRGVDKLARQSISSSPVASNGGRDFWKIEQAAAAGTPSVNWNTQKGWYLDLPVEGERVVENMQFYDSTNLLAVYSHAPAYAPAPVCEKAASSAPGTAERQFVTIINAIDGAAPRVQLVDVNSDGLYNAKDASASRIEGKGGPMVSVFTKPDMRAHVHPDGTVDKLARPPTVALRPSWRHLQ
ncbi:MAG: hypothetical protein EOO32_00395 [Comamonadaceae bacterium]|nr:MAG: hypothetical protein EOO32_00395 [Comamonadaceae bacterium]